MKKTLRTMAICLALSVSTAHAEKEGLFYGANVSDADVDIDQSISGVSLQLGYQFNSYFGVDGRIGVFSNEASSIIRDPLLKQYALLGRAGYEWEQASVYGLLGYGNTLNSVADNEDGLMKGVEINLFGSPATALSLGYLSQTMDGDDFNTVSIGFVHFLGITSDQFSLRHPSKDQ